MDRRTFLQWAGFGTLAAGSGHTLAQALASEAFADEGRTNFHFDCQVRGPLVGNVQHFLAMAGCGGFNDVEVEGRGGFLHIS